MEIRIHWLAQLRSAAGKADETIQINDGATLAELLTHLAESAEEPLRRQLCPEGDKPTSLMLVVNDQNIAPQAAEKQILAPNDEVTLLPPISGG